MPRTKKEDLLDKIVADVTAKAPRKRASRPTDEPRVVTASDAAAAPTPDETKKDPAPRKRRAVKSSAKNPPVDEGGDTPKNGLSSEKSVAQDDGDHEDMAALLAKHPIVLPAPGDVLSGTIIDSTPSTLLIDLGALGTGVVLGREIKSGIESGKLSIGDTVHATLITLENDDGNIELSIREASYERAWEDLEQKKNNQDLVATRILSANRGGLMVEVNGVSGFLPVSQLSNEHYPRVDDGDKNKILDLLRNLVGQELTVRILDLNREGEKLIVSEKAAQQERERRLVSNLKPGDVIEGDVSGVVDFGVFIKFVPPGIENGERVEGLVHISEIAWQLIDDPREMIKTGDHVKAKVIGVDGARISLSIKALQHDPWTEIGDKYHVSDIVPGTIDKMNHFGAFVYVDQDIHGLAHVSEFQQAFPGRKMSDAITVGKTYKWKILSIEPRSHRMGLLLDNDAPLPESEAIRPRTFARGA